MTVQPQNVYSSAVSKVQLNQKLPLLTVCIDAEDHLTNEIAHQIFTTQYDKLFKIKNARLLELSDLTKEKNSLEKTWIPYLVNGSFANCFPRYSEICIVQLVAWSCLGTGFFIGGLTTTGWGVLGVGGGITFAEILFPCLPCVQNVLECHSKVLSKISTICKQEREITQLIKFTNVFAQFCSEWPQLVQKFEIKDQLRSFKLLKDILQDYDSNIVKIAEEEFLHLAPLFLMEKVCTLSPNGELAHSWKHIKATPELWENNDLWEKVQMKTPSGTDYIDFFKAVNKHIAVDPSRWGEWFSNKLEIYIEKSKTLGSI